MKLIEDLNQSLEIENKASHADRLFNGLSLASGGLACALLLSALIAYAVNIESGLFAFAVVFYPIAALIVVSYIFGIGELLRNRYFTSIMAVTLTSVVLLGTVAFLILQGVFFGGAAVFPFYQP